MVTMRCPGCDVLLDAPASACSKCKFTLGQLDAKFGTVPLHTRYVTDRAQSLTLEELNRLRDLLYRFENKFPQLLFSVFVTDLPGDTSIREFTFWLANRAQFSSADAEGAGNFDLLLVIEPTRPSAALTVGYGLETYLSEDDLQAALSRAQSALVNDQIEVAIRLCLEETTRLLRIACDVAAAATSNTRAHSTVDQW